MNEHGTNNPIKLSISCIHRKYTLHSIEITNMNTLYEEHWNLSNHGDEDDIDIVGDTNTHD